MRVSRAQLSDESSLKKFFESFTIPGQVELRVIRPDHFANYYELQSHNFETYILWRSDGTVLGCASLIFRQAKIESQAETVAYATDLRISPTREAITGWTRYLLPTIRTSLDHHGARFLFSVLSNQNFSTTNTFTRPRSQRRNIPTYHLVRHYDLVSVLGRIPLLNRPLKTISISRATLDDVEPLAQYLKTKSSARPFAFVYTPELLIHRWQSWPGFGPRSFLLAKDKSGNIRGVVAPWQNPTQRLFIEKYNGFAETAKTAIRMGSWLNITTKLPPIGQELPIEYLTHFYADNPDIFDLLLEESYRAKAPGSVLNYVHFHQHPLMRPPKHFIVSRSTSAFYVVAPLGGEPPQELLYNQIDVPPELEACLL